MIGVVQALHFSPSLYRHVVIEQRKPLVLVLNKVDLVPAALAISWRHYFLARFPQLRVVLFTSFPKLDDERHRMQNQRTTRAKGISCSVFTAAYGLLQHAHNQ